MTLLLRVRGGVGDVVRWNFASQLESLRRTSTQQFSSTSVRLHVCGSSLETVAGVVRRFHGSCGLGSLYAHANEFTMKEAADFHVKWTPRGWMRPDLDLLGFEQHLYLRQPGYGTSYITGKYLLERLIQERSQQLGDQFSMRGFFDAMNAAGMIPVSLIRWQMTGRDDEIKALRSR